MRKKFRKPMAVGMSLALLCASMPAANEAQAASNPKLSTSSLSLKVGQSKKLTVKGASGTVKWSSSNKKVVVVAKTTNKAAKVTAKKAGTAQVSAKVGKKVLKCKVTVKKANPNNATTTEAPAVQAPATNAPVVSATNGPTTNATASQAPNTQDTSAPSEQITNAPDPQESSAPEPSASVQPTETATEAPTPTPSATDDPSIKKMLVKLILSEDGKTVVGVEDKYKCYVGYTKYAIIPDGVSSIDWMAFSGCLSLTTITIPDTVTSIGGNAFWNVPHIEYHGSAEGAPWGAKSMN